MANRKLGRSVDQRAAILRNLTTALIWNGKIVTTEARAKEVRSIAEKLITLAVKEYKNTETVEKETRNEKSQVVKVEKKVDKPSKLAARRQIMSYLYDVPEPKAKDENKVEYKDIAPRVDKRIEEGKKGGYTRMYKLGQRRGDAAEMVVLEII